MHAFAPPPSAAGFPGVVVGQTGDVDPRPIPSEPLMCFNVVAGRLVPQHNRRLDALPACFGAAGCPCAFSIRSRRGRVAEVASAISTWLGTEPNPEFVALAQQRLDGRERNPADPADRMMDRDQLLRVQQALDRQLPISRPAHSRSMQTSATITRTDRQL